VSYFDAGRRIDEACNGANRTRGRVTRSAGTAVAPGGRRRSSMLMFKRSQLYVGFALAALAEIIIRAAAAVR